MPKSFLQILTVTIFLLGFLSIAGQSDNQTVNEKCDRISQLQHFLKLDLIRINNRDQTYLDSLDAGFDEDNQQYFIDFGNGDNGDLCTLSFRRPGSTEIRFFPQACSDWCWLGCRLRTVGDRLFTRLLIYPDGTCSDLAVTGSPCNAFQAGIAMAPGE